jgi:phosphohistidine phosphatase
MKTLYLLRHAKSSWDNPAISDFDRPLNQRGLEAAPFMGKIIFDRKIQPCLILSSPAMRAKQTALLIKETAQISAKIQYEETIYEASPMRLLEIISELDKKYDSVLMVGHNPGFENLYRILTNEIQPIQTATLAKINLNINKWSDINANCGESEFIIRPKDQI